MIQMLLLQLTLLIAGMTLAWAYQRHVGNAGWVDVFWTFTTGIAGIAGALWPIPMGTACPLRQGVVVGLAAFWSLRLGLHLRVRVRDRPEDRRYNGFRRSWGAEFQRKLFIFLMFQAIAALPLAAAIALAAHNPAPCLDALDYLGLGVIMVAILGEGLADRQLARFTSDRRNAGRVCDVGLWSWSRHPNYFFEFLGWCGWPLLAFNADWAWGLGAWSAPVLMYGLLVYVSGVPPLEQVMLASRGEAYRAYQRRTSKFFPLPPRHNTGKNDD